MKSSHLDKLLTTVLGYIILAATLVFCHVSFYTVDMFSFNDKNKMNTFSYIVPHTLKHEVFLHAQKWTTWSMLSTTCCNVVLHTVRQCCAAPCQQLLSTIIVHSCSRSTTIVQSLLTTINKLFSSTIVSSCSNNIVITIVLCQHQTTIDRTILIINIVNSTSVVEPW